MDEVIYEGRAYVINVGRFNWLAGPDFDEWDAQERERWLGLSPLLFLFSF